MSFHDDQANLHPCITGNLFSFMSLYYCTTDHIYRNYLPSLVATACIASSRWCLHITPPWTGELENLSGYTWDDLHPLVQNMLRWVHFVVQNMLRWVHFVVQNMLRWVHFVVHNMLRWVHFVVQNMLRWVHFVVQNMLRWVHFVVQMMLRC